jgi:hypothetical protein
MQKMREIADRLFKATPELIDGVSADALLKPKIDSEKHLEGFANNSGHPISNSSQKNRNLGNFPHPNSPSMLPPMKEELTAIEIQKNYQDYVRMFVDQQQLNIDLKNERDEKSKRFIKREQEYRKIIEDLTKDLRPNLMVNPGEKKMLENIIGFHEKILENISLVQIRTSKILLDQERDIIHFYNSKINELREQFEEENEKQAKRDQDFLEKENKLMSELEWIKGIAQKIDVENHYLVKRYTELKVEYQTQENDRQMLLKEVVLQKNRKELLVKKIDYYKELVQKSMINSADQQTRAAGQNRKTDSVNIFMSKPKVRRQFR